MPGLFGLLALDQRHGFGDLPVDAWLESMAGRLQHTGAERIELRRDGSRGLAFGRIGPARIDAPDWPIAPSGGSTPPPVWFDDGVVLADGALGAVEVDPFPRLREMEGFFQTLAVGTRRSTVSVDRRASRPIAWTRVRAVDGEGDVRELVAFAPEVKALLGFPGVDRRPRPADLGMFFASGFLLADRTFFDGVHRLEGGTALVVGEGRCRVERWADYRFTPEGDGTPYETLRDELGDVMRAATARHLGDPERTAVFLSGGKDSRILVASAAQTVDPARVRAISWTADAEPAPGSDVYLARQIAARLGVRHQVVRRTVQGFAEKALRLTWILDGLTDIGAFHGDELRLMEDLAEQGFDRVLRGDQCFTRGRAMLDPSYAILRMCIRSTSGLATARGLWHEQAWRAASDGADGLIAGLGAEYAGRQEDNAGDEVYFRHRLQGYLNAAGYFKQLHLDHRNPLLDEAVLRLIQRLSVAARREQKILNEAGAATFPEVWNLGFAETSNLEDFADLLHRDTPVRRAVARVLDDRRSGLWEILDREALRDRFGRLGRAPERRGRLRRGFVRAKNLVRDAVYDIPSIDVRLRGVYLRRITRDDEVFLRTLSLHHFFELFVDGAGDPERYAALQAESRAESVGEGDRAS